MNHPIPTIQVKVRDHETESARWGYGRGGPIVRKVVIPAICPQCGGPRGKVRGMNGCDDGDYYHVNVWDNPCGHNDWYHNVLVEAGYHAPKDPNKPRIVRFWAKGPDGTLLFPPEEGDHLRVYRVPQDAWHPEMTEADCAQVSAAEIWAAPTNSTEVGSDG